MKSVEQLAQNVLGFLNHKPGCSLSNSISSLYEISKKISFGTLLQKNVSNNDNAVVIALLQSLSDGHPTLLHEATAVTIISLSEYTSNQMAVRGSCPLQMILVKAFARFVPLLCHRIDDEAERSPSAYFSLGNSNTTPNNSNNPKSIEIYLNAINSLIIATNHSIAHSKKLNSRLSDLVWSTISRTPMSRPMIETSSTLFASLPLLEQDTSTAFTSSVNLATNMALFAALKSYPNVFVTEPNSYAADPDSFLSNLDSEGLTNSTQSLAISHRITSLVSMLVALFSNSHNSSDDHTYYLNVPTDLLVDLSECLLKFGLGAEKRENQLQSQRELPPRGYTLSPDSALRISSSMRKLGHDLLESLLKSSPTNLRRRAKRICRLVNQNLEIAFAKKKNVECQTRALQLLQLVGLNLGCGCFHLLSKSIEIATICLYKLYCLLDEDDKTSWGTGGRVDLAVHAANCLKGIVGGGGGEMIEGRVDVEVAIRLSLESFARDGSNVKSIPTVRMHVAPKIALLGLASCVICSPGLNGCSSNLLPVVRRASNLFLAGSKDESLSMAAVSTLAICDTLELPRSHPIEKPIFVDESFNDVGRFLERSSLTATATATAAAAATATAAAAAAADVEVEKETETETEKGDMIIEEMEHEKKEEVQVQVEVQLVAKKNNFSFEPASEPATTSNKRRRVEEVIPISSTYANEDFDDGDFVMPEINVDAGAD